MTADSAAPRRASPRRHSSKPAAPTSSHQSTDVYFGHEYTAKMSAAFITSLFSCPDLPPPSSHHASNGTPAPSPKLARFIAYALHRTRLASSVTFAALFLLQRLKARFPAARGSSGHRLFISAFMIASKVVCDDTYSNKSWCVVGQGMFSLREINQMEREMCGYLEWVLNIGQSELEVFTNKVQLEYGSGAPVAAPAKLAPSPSTSSVEASYPPAPIVPVVASEPSYPSPASTTSGRAATPGSSSPPESPSHSDTTSPASSSPQTPPSNADDDSAPHVHQPNSMAGIPKVMQTGNVGIDSKMDMQNDHLGASTGTRNYAYAAPAVW